MDSYRIDRFVAQLFGNVDDDRFIIHHLTSSGRSWSERIMPKWPDFQFGKLLQFIQRAKSSLLTEKLKWLTTSVNIPNSTFTTHPTFEGSWERVKGSRPKNLNTSSTRRGGSSKVGLGYRKSMAYRKGFAMQKQWSVEVTRCTNEWANGCWDASEMTWKNPFTTESEWMNSWTNKLTKQWTNEPVG